LENFFREVKKMPANFKKIAIMAVVVLAVLAVVSRVPQVRDIVFPETV